MAEFGDSSGALASARRALAARDAELVAADRALAEAVAGAHALAVASTGRIDAIAAELDATTEAPRDNPAAARELSRHLVGKNREIAAIIAEAQAAAHAKAVALQELIASYQ
jgi:hypothetical protein